MGPNNGKPGYRKLYFNEVKVIKSWISTCMKEHKCCIPLKPGHFFPTRLIDLRAPVLRLVDGKDLKSSDGGYAALSYCWGTTMPEGGKTTRDTMHARQAEIDLNFLPRTLREAIYVARILDIPFIWIDALCIIQGDAEDWTKESATMYQVYSHALVTIAAALSDHCDGGFLLPRVTKDFRGTRRKFPINSSEFFRSLDTSWEFPIDDHEVLKSLEKGSNLSKRGWALQERHLSTRVINFNDKYVIWECRELVFYYSTSSRNHPTIYEPKDSWYQEFQRCFDSMDAKRNFWALRGHREVWKAMVISYTTRSFTNPEDKLLAISGLAEAMKPFINCSYLFGLWTADLLKEMLWYRKEGKAVHPPYSHYYAPSWSWTSGNFPINWDGMGYDPRVTLNPPAKTARALIFEVSAISTPIYQTRGGFIRLESMTRSLDALGCSEMILKFDNVEYSESGLPFRKKEAEAIERKAEIDPANSLPRKLSELVICDIMSTTDETRDKWTRVVCEGLILESTQRTHNGIPEYKRVGFAREILIYWIEWGTRQEIILV